MSQPQHVYRERLVDHGLDPPGEPAQPLPSLAGKRATATIP